MTTPAMTAALPQRFDAEAYWASREFKKWVVILTMPKGRNKPEQRDTKYVRARTRAGAIRTAKAHSTLPLRASAYAVLATPRDLGCEPTGGAK